MLIAAQVHIEGEGLVGCPSPSQVHMEGEGLAGCPRSWVWMGRVGVSCDLVNPNRSGVGAPVVGEVDGDYSYDAKKHVLNWRLAVIDSSNSQGSMEFSIAGMPDDFFPIKVSFLSTKSYCNIEVSWGEGPISRHYQQ